MNIVCIVQLLMLVKFIVDRLLDADVCVMINKWLCGPGGSTGEYTDDTVDDLATEHV